MNVLSQERQIQILNVLVEVVAVGERCQRFLDERLQGFRSQHLQLDEIWTFVRKKERRLSELERLNPDIGDQYVFVAIDAETKLVASFIVDKRDGRTAIDAGPGRYSPPRVSETVSTVIQGAPDPEHISTSYVERQNLSMRMAMRRFTRLTNAFSKKLANLKAALAVHFVHYNFLRVHRTLRVTPAMEAAITDHIWTWAELLAYETN